MSNYKLRTGKMARKSTGGSVRETEHVPRDQDTDTGTNTSTQESESEQEEHMDGNSRKRLKSSGTSNPNSSNGDIPMKISHTSGSTETSRIGEGEHFTSSNLEITQKRKKVDALLDELQADNDDRLKKVVKDLEEKRATEIKQLNEKIERLEKEKSDLQKLLNRSVACFDKASKSIDETNSGLKKTSESIQNYVSTCGQTWTTDKEEM